MSEIEFDADSAGRPTQAPGSVLYGRFETSNKLPKLVQFLINAGIVKTEKAATTVLFATFVVLVAASVYLFVSASSSNEDEAIKMQERLRAMSLTR